MCCWKCSVLAGTLNEKFTCLISTCLGGKIKGSILGSSACLSRGAISVVLVQCSVMFSLWHLLLLCFNMKIDTKQI